MSNPWVALVGSRSDGRGRALAEVLGALRRAGLRLGGAVQEALEVEGERRGFDIVDLATGRRRALARQAAEPRLCQWGFDPDAFAEVRRWVDAGPHDVVVLSLGSLEAAGEGHWATVQAALRGPPALLLLEIRPKVLSSVALRLPDPADGLELPAAPVEVQGFAARVVRAALEGRGGARRGRARRTTDP